MEGRAAFIALSFYLGLCLSTPVQAQEIVVGLVGPMTGHQAVFGRQMRNGADLAISDITAAGGLLGHRIKLEVLDDACDPQLAKTVAQNLTSMKAQVVIGHFCSSSSMVASDVYAESNTLQITPSSTNPNITDRGLWNVFRICGRDDKQGSIAASYVAKTFRDRSIAIVHDQSLYGSGLAEEMKKALNTAGVREKLYDTYAPSENDFTALVTKFKRNGIELVYVGGYHRDIGSLLRQMREQGIRAQLMAGDSLADKEFAAIAGPAIDGALFTFGPDPRKNPSAAAILARFRAKGIDPDGYTLYVYAALQLWAAAVINGGTLDAKRVAETMRDGTWDTALGPLSFDKKGDNTKIEWTIYKWDKTGNYEEP
jgi:branched-chain amino acid transport system substrate-binding protein